MDTLTSRSIITTLSLLAGSEMDGDANIAGSTHSENETAMEQQLSDAEQISPINLQLAWFLPISTVLWSVNVIGNAAVLLCVLRDKKLHRPSYYLVAALSLADISFPLFGFAPMTYGAFVRDSPTTCDRKFKFFILLPTNVVATASYLTLVCLQVERYCSLAFPVFHRRTVTKRRALAVVASLWVFSTVSSVVFYPSPEAISNTSPLCPTFSFEFGIMVVTMGISGILFLSCMNVHFLILLGLRFSQSARTRRVGNNDSRVRARLQELRALRDAERGDRNNDNRGNGAIGTQASKSIGIVVIFFILCWLPITILCLLETICNRQHVDRTLLSAARRAIIILFLLNGAINPVVYARKNPHLRVAFWKLIGKKSIKIGETSDKLKTSSDNRLNTVTKNVGSSSTNNRNSSTTPIAAGSGRQPNQENLSISPYVVSSGRCP